MAQYLGTIRKNQIQRYRKKRNLRQKDVAKLVGVQNHSNLYRWETGQKLPTLTSALKLSAALKCPVELLFLDHYKEIQRKMYGKQLE